MLRNGLRISAPSQLNYEIINFQHLHPHTKIQNLKIPYLHPNFDSKISDILENLVAIALINAKWALIGQSNVRVASDRLN